MYDSSITANRCQFIENFGGVAGGFESHEGAEAIVMNSLFVGNRSAKQGSAIQFWDQDDARVINCMLVDNWSEGDDPAGILNFRSGEGTEITNTIIYDNRGPAIWERDSVDPTVTNCLFFGNADGVYQGEDVGLIRTVDGEAGLNSILATAMNNLSADPMFINTKAGNYRLQSGSPGIDGGTAEGARTDDFDGETRSLKGPRILPDIGYDELFDDDADGTPDWWETLHGLQVSVAAAVGDLDGDELSNGDEYVLGTNPEAVYTDGDGRSDSVEVAAGSDPLDELWSPVYVSREGDNTTGDSWATALFSVGDAVAQAADEGKDVWVAEGTYNIGSPINLESFMAIYGGFSAMMFRMRREIAQSRRRER